MDENQNQGGNTPPVTTETTVTTPTTTESSGTTPKEPSTTFTFNEQTIMASLSYVGPLILVPFLTKKEDPFINFHIRQGLQVFIMTFVIWIFSNWLFGLSPFLKLASFVALVFSIIGIINALKLNEKELPYIGKWGRNIKI